MLSGLLNSDVAIEANISIMRAFVYVRQVLLIPAPDDRMMILENRMKVDKTEHTHPKNGEELA